ncbi:MAG TPA: RecX family transcriptional regulator [Myxococcaceae bacterium]|nr:RecX family transcriptional regulator [Myxococcaceae bacterium]
MRRTRQPRPPKPPEDPHRAALDQALRLISIRARTHQELRQAFRRKELPEDAQDAAIERLVSWGYLDDARFARDRARALLREGRLGSRAVVDRLRRHGLSLSEAQEATALAEVELEVDPLEAARSILERRGLLGAADMKTRARAFRLLQSRGFSGETARQALRLAALDPDGADE